MNGNREKIRYRLIKGFEDETIVNFLTLEEINKIKVFINLLKR
jgi:hypothetical protein